jgi:Kef-type K+ transport system membrane component KefB
MNLFSVFILTVIVSSIFALLFYFINIPSLISYIFAGFFLSRLNLVATEFISILGELGIIFLLFLVGLRLDFNKFKEFSKICM